jgi:hypothetical protein
VDLLIAAATEDRGSSVVRHGADLRGIGTVTGRPVRRLAPAASLP